jgi:hypothetical protein
MPITKVDKERRIVTGWATLDNLDRQNDVVDAEASVKAFATFRNNLREMHQPIAAGRVLSFKQDKYFDPNSKKFYNGIVVSAYVSKGAQDTWEKVLDGTLTGFSIGGEINETDDVYDENLGKSYRVIKDYTLSELSLVDNPANQFANVLGIEKGMATGYLSKTVTENVFWCRDDDVVRMSSDASTNCPQCDKGMNNIGFVESNDSDKAGVVKSMITEIKKDQVQNGIVEDTYVKFDGTYGKVLQIIFKGGARLSSEEIVHFAKSNDPLTVVKMYSQKDGTIVPTDRRVIKNISSLEKVNAISKSEVKEVSKMESDVIVVDEIEKSMSEEQVNPDLENAIPVSVTDNTQSTEKGIEIEVEEEDEGEEEEETAKADEAVDVAKEIAPMPGFSDGFDDQLDPIKMQVAEIAKSIESALSTLAETVQALDAKIEGVNKSVAGLSTEVNEVKDSFGKRVDAVEKDTAFRKSADLGEILQEEPQIPIKKGLWGGSFLKTADL